MLFLIGVLLNLWLPALTALVRWNIGELNSWLLMGTLQRIAVGYLIATCVVLVLDDTVSQAVAAIALVAVYTCIFYLAPAPGFLRGDFSEAGNAVTYIDRLFLGSHSNLSHPILNTLPAAAMVLLGGLVGRMFLSGWKLTNKMGLLIGAGALLALAAFFLSGTIPINYRLWTPSFFMAAGGIACICFALLHKLLEYKRVRRGAHFLRVLGMNPILIWVVAVVMKSLLGAKGFVNTDGRWRSIWLVLHEKISIGLLSPEINSLIFAMFFSIAIYGIAQVCYRRKIFIRI
jgi:predicted acyltransferase